jgi:hypothetical protein
VCERRRASGGRPYRLPNAFDEDVAGGAVEDQDGVRGGSRCDAIWHAVVDKAAAERDIAYED